MADILSKIQLFENETTLEATANQNGNPETDIVIDAESPKVVDPAWSIPIANSAAEYASNHIAVSLEGSTTVYTFWQTGGSVFYSLDGTWNTTQYMETISGKNGIFLIQEGANNAPWIVGEIAVED